MNLDAIPWATVYVASEWALRLAALIIVPVRRSPAAARAWLLLILFLPWPGVLLYLLIGRAYLPRRRLALQQTVYETIRRVEPRALTGEAHAVAGVPPALGPALELAARVSEFPPVSGNRFELLPDYDPAIERLIADIDNAHSYVHLLYYIFEDDETGERVCAALLRARARDVAVRVLMDAVGSREGLARFGPELEATGAEVVAVMPLGLWGPNAARIDLRNHRKIAVIDGRVAYFGSQNVVSAHANPGLVNEELAVRATGPIVRHLHAVLLGDRYIETGDLPDESDDLSPAERVEGPDGFAQVLPSGPGYNEGTAEAVMTALLYGAQKRVVLTSPYVVPSDAFLAAMCTAAKRGVDVVLIVDDESNKPLVQLAQESYYDTMLAAGVRIMKHHGSFLHAKHMSVDDEIVLIGSSNLDIRSFALNAEVSVLICDDRVVAALVAIQHGYLAAAAEVTREMRARVPRVRRWLENLARLTDSVL